jgi:TrmH family RNA methyltransferase
MISKGTIRYIKSLQLKKYRNKAQSFLVEGTKSVLELLASRYQVTHLIGTETFFEDNDGLPAKLNGMVATVKEKQLGAISSLKANDSVLAVARYLPETPFTLEADEYCIALDRVRDPGNLGAIIRIADWYGITKLACSTDCADFYNPKVIQASMGSFTRIAAYYGELKSLLAGHKVYGTALQGENVHKLEFSKGGIILVGNEAQGISEDLNTLVSTWISIPRFGAAESLNAAIATAVVCDNLLRRK